MCVIVVVMVVGRIVLVSLAIGMTMVATILLVPIGRESRMPSVGT